MVLSVINLFLWTTAQHIIGHFHAVRGLSETASGIQRLGVWPVRSPDLNPLKMCWDALGGKLLVRKLSSDKQEHPRPCTHRGMG
ncbi:hypothetical protein TNCV_912761 [Trichonephila clavipes]|nr:hypothetical protein TNCV_912761 [Trichonephila clavipes]